MKNMETNKQTKKIRIDFEDDNWKKILIKLLKERQNRGIKQYENL
jgi:hypothetical protein